MDPNGGDTFAQYGIGEYAPGSGASKPAMPEGDPSAEGGRPRALISPEEAEETLARDLAEVIRERSGS